MRGVLWKAVLTAIVVVLSLYFLIPTIRLAFISDEQREENPGLVDELQMKGIKLGLDLQGGTHLVLEVDTTNLPVDLDTIPIDIALEVIRSRVDQFGVAEPTIQKVGSRRIIVELPGIQNIEHAKQLVQETAVLEFRLMRDKRDVQRFIDGMDKLLTSHPELMELAKRNILTAEESTSIAKKGSTAAETSAGTQSESTAVDTSTAKEMAQDTTPTMTMGQLMAKKDSSEAKPESTLTGASIFAKESTAAPEVPEISSSPFTSLVDVEENSIFVSASNVDLVANLLELPQVKELYRGSVFLWDAHYRSYQGIRVKELYMLRDNVELTGDHLTKARWHLGSGYDPKTAGKPVIDLEFDGAGGRIFSKVTGANIKRRLAIVLNQKVYTAPVIQTKIRNGRAEITGINDISEAKVITIVLRAGSLPVPLKIVEERTVGPTLGEDSIRNGVRAAIIGLIIVILFMLIYYRFAGIVANIALILNLIILMAAMALLHATLTLPGIAGIILTIGMAVDANVLIYERIREEIRAGRTIRMAIEAGYSRAIITIVDANITTLVAAIILYYFGTGPIRGFAVTLGLGIVISMYTAIVVTRMIFDWYIAAFRKEALAI
ncbi:protein translocase subunit SecD [bacterium]|nr:protein translocase subunit SecD [bacterium]